MLQNICKQIFCVVRRSLAVASKFFSKIKSRDFPKMALEAKTTRFGVVLYLGRKSARRPERLGNQRQTEPDAKWLYQTLGVGGRVKKRESEEQGQAKAYAKLSQGEDLEC